MIEVENGYFTKLEKNGHDGPEGLYACKIQVIKDKGVSERANILIGLDRTIK